MCSPELEQQEAKVLHRHEYVVLGLGQLGDLRPHVVEHLQLLGLGRRVRAHGAPQRHVQRVAGEGGVVRLAHEIAPATACARGCNRLLGAATECARFAGAHRFTC